MANELGQEQAENRTSRVTPLQRSGWAVVAIGLASLVGALLLNWRELLVLSVGCAAILLMSAPFLIGRTTIALERRLVPDRVTVGDLAVVELHGRNGASIPTARQTINEAVDGEPVPLTLRAMKPGEQTVVRWEPSTARRGRYRLGPARITKTDPFRLMQRDVGQTGVDELWVHPRVARLSAVAGGLTKDMDGPTFDHSPAGDVAFHAIRQYELGDDARHVHWMATARAGELMVRQYVDNRQPYMSVIIDTNRSSWASADEFEIGIEIAASLALSALERSQPGSVHAGHKTLLGRHHGSTPDQLLDDLTLVKADEVFDLAKAAVPLVRAERNTTNAFLITGSARVGSSLAIATTNLSNDCGVTVVRVGDSEDDAGVPGRGVRFIEATNLDDFVVAAAAMAAS